MPIEIKELNIKAFVNDTSMPQSGLPKNHEHAGAGSNEAIIAACVEQVMQILKDKEER